MRGDHANASAALGALTADLVHALGLKHPPWGLLGEAAFAAARDGRWTQVRAVVQLAQDHADRNPGATSPRWLRRLALVAARGAT
jgi:hypothetical protein